VLVGFMGTGKSTVGRALARRLRRPFFDTDAWAECEAGMRISQLFSEFGEQAFRDVETLAAEEVARRRRLVVSTGGGILGREHNVALLRASGVLICLTASPDEILRRTTPWESRPLLRDAADPRLAVETLLAERASLYAQADWCLDTSVLPIPELVNQICEKLPSLFRAHSTPS
jgi:shikimate kinase